MRSRLTTWTWLAVWTGIVLGWTAKADAHRIRPSIVTATISDSGQLRVDMQVNAEALIVGIGPEHVDTDDSPQKRAYDELRALAPADLEARLRLFEPTLVKGLGAEFDGAQIGLELMQTVVPEIGDLRTSRISRLSLSGAIPATAQVFRWSYAAQFGDCVLKVHVTGRDEVASFWLKNGTASDPVDLGEDAAARSWWATAWQYTVLGITHIIPKGLDHILFVIGIFLLSMKWRPLLFQVTAFTIAHSITLGLAMFGVLRLSPSIVEPLIALSIAYVGIENVFFNSLKPWRIVVIFAFGLLHGMGFAGVLTEIGLPRSDFVTALITFNVGVELGQLSVIVLAYGLVGVWFHRKTWYRQRVIVPASAAIALVGLYWTFERIIA